MSAVRRRRIRPLPATRPAAPSGAGAAHAASPGPPAYRLKECPFCLKQVPEVALECPDCGRRIAGAGSSADFQRRLLAQELILRQVLKEDRLDVPRGGLLGGLRLRTVAASVTAGACLLLWLYTFFMPELEWLPPLAIAGAVLSAVVVVAFGIDDLSWVAVRQRRHPAAALTAFVKAMKVGRYGEAYACVLPGDRNGRIRTRKAVSVLGLDSARCTFADLTGFRIYWQPIFSDPESSISLSRPEVTLEQGDFAVVSASLSVRRQAGGFGGGLVGALVRSALAGSDELPLRKLVRRVKERWYLVNGELDSPEDQATEEIALMAAATDAQLIELSRAKPAQPDAPAG